MISSCFHALMESTADSIYFKDRQCRLLRVSRMMAQSLGSSDPAELIGKTDIDLYGERSAREPDSTTSGSWRRAGPSLVWSRDAC